MLKTTEEMVQELHDKQAIYEKILAYTRGTDRLDRDLALSAYHPDAIDDHGLFCGGPEEFTDWNFALHSKAQTVTQHLVTNFFCQVDGDTAHAETYWMFIGRNRQGPALSLSGGRYVDRFERRDGEWAIAARKCVPEWRGAPGESWLAPEAVVALAGGGTVARDKTDASYERPLNVDPSRVGYAYRF